MIKNTIFSKFEKKRIYNSKNFRSLIYIPNRNFRLIIVKLIIRSEFEFN